uniref:Polyprotein P1234 n=1 Tax=Eastern equine encephalitis virus TaxID=11021 RepID=A0A142MU61_EEEV|nr:non-structural polyprotein precursor P1234 [Eastern equine encephalitis virus]
MEKVHVDLDADSPFVKSLQRCFPHFEIEATQVTDNDHANARAFSHLATKLIEGEVDTDQVILDIGSAPVRHTHSKHKYHCICPMKSAEDPDRLYRYADKLRKSDVTDKCIASKAADLLTVMSTPDAETPSLCMHTDSTCRYHGSVAVYQDVYAVHAPTSIYYQALKGVRTIYWIGFDTTPFMYKNMAGAYPTYNTNWADESVLEARNIGLGSSDLHEKSFGKVSIMRKKKLQPTNKVIFSVGSTIYTEERILLRSWHLPNVFHLKGKTSFTGRCNTIVSCEGYVVKKITLSPGIYGKVDNLASTMHREGFLSCKVTDTLRGERVSFPVCTYVPATLCDQMTGILATDVSVDDAQKLLVGLNQRIVVNGRTQRNTNTMQNYLLPVVAQAFSRWAREHRADLEDEKGLGVRERSLVMGCCWAFKTHKITSIYKRPGTQTIKKVPAVFNSFVIPQPTSYGLDIGLRRRIKMLFDAKKAPAPIITEADVAHLKGLQEEAEAVAEAEAVRAALPPLLPEVDKETVEADIDLIMQEAGAGSVETPRRHIKVTTYPGEEMIGSYAVLSPQAVLNSEKLACIHPLAEQVLVMTHKGRAGRYKVEPYHGRVIVPSGTAIPIPDFQALSESATIVFNEREFVNRYLHHIAVNGGALNTDEEYYKVVKSTETDSEYVFDIDAKKCVKKGDAGPMCLVGELVDPPFHEFAYESLKTRPAAPHKVPTIGVYGVPGSGKSGIIKSAVTKRDLVVSAKKENCMEIIKDVKRMRGMDIAARTVDSVLLNGVKHSVDTLYIDEAFACHAGTLLALIAIVKPKKVVLCGDPKQCGFFNMMCLKVHFNHEICTEVYHKSISRRCTKTVTSIVSTLFYDKRMRTVNPCNDKIIIDTTSTTKPLKDDIILTCFRGWVKQLQIDYKNHEIMTAAASQGLTRKGVYAVRYKVNENPLYAQTSEHVNVLLTRTEKRIVWKTLAGDPWIKTLTASYPGNFTATLEEWQAEHDAIMAKILETPASSDVFQNKVNVCWAKALEPVLATANITLTRSQWETIPAFKDDKAYSPEMALNFFCTRFFGVDIDSGLFSAPTVPLTYTNEHWDNSPGPNMYGLCMRTAKELARRYPCILKAADTGRVADVRTDTIKDYNPLINVVPLNRRLPHSLVVTHRYTGNGDYSQLVTKMTGKTVLVVGTPMNIPGKRVETLGPSPQCTYKAELDLGIPAALGKYDIIFINVRTPYRHHHYQQCEDHAIHHSMLTRKAVDHLNKGGTCIALGYGTADRATENIISAVARSFRFSRVCQPKCAWENTEVAFVFFGKDNGNHLQDQDRLSVVLNNIYQGSTQHEAGRAPAYRVVRGDITKSNDEVIVNAANNKGQPGGGVCGALYRKWPGAFDKQPVATGKAHLVKHSPNVIHAVGPNFSRLSENEGDQKLSEVYMDIARIINNERFTKVSIPLLSTGIYAGGKDRVMQSLNHLFTAMDTTDADITIYCLDKHWESRIKEAITRKESVEELTEDDRPVDIELVRVHPLSSLAGRPGYSTTEGKVYSYLEGTRFHQTAKDIAEIYAMWPNKQEANEQICLYVLGESMNSIRSKCPVEESEASSPPHTIPCLCNYAMTAERVYRLRMAKNEQFAVCSSFQLPKYRITGVQKIQCSKPVIFSGTVPPAIHPRKFASVTVEDTPVVQPERLVPRRPAPPVPVPARIPSPPCTSTNGSTTSIQSLGEDQSASASSGAEISVDQVSLWSIPSATGFDVRTSSSLSLEQPTFPTMVVEAEIHASQGSLWSIPSITGSETRAPSPPSQDSRPSTPSASGSHTSVDLITFDSVAEILEDFSRSPFQFLSEIKPIPAPRTRVNNMSRSADTIKPIPKPRKCQVKYTQPPGVARAISAAEFDEFVRRHSNRRYEAGAYIFSSETGQGHLQQKSTRQCKLQYPILERSVHEKFYAPRLDLEREKLLQKKLQLCASEGNRSRYQSRKVENMKAITVERLLQGIGSYLSAEPQPVECYKVTYPAPMYSSTASNSFSSAEVAVKVCNLVLQENFPTVASYNITDEYDAYLDMVDGASCCLDTATFCPAKLRSFPKKHSYLRPEIRSAVPSPIQNTLQNVLAAATKRNCNVTQMRELPVLDSAAFNVECFKKYACNDEYWDFYKTNPIRLTAENVTQYVTKLKGPKAAALFAKTHNLQPLHEIPMDRFVMDLKRDVKVTPGTKHTEERPKVQVIQAADPLATAYLCGIHRELVRRLNAVLLPNIHTLFDMSAEDFDAIIAEHFQFGDAVLETDIASFDKSEDDAIAMSALMILEDLGVDQALLNLIEAAFGNITSVHLPTGTRFKFGAMMKSGMFLTLFINTVVNIMIASRVLRERLTTSPCAAFIGDDNIVKGVTSDALMAERCATWLNMEVKIIDAVVGVKAPYFCGGFIVVDQITGTACRVADPLKRLFKLGKPLPLDDDQDVDRRRALHDEAARWNRIGITEELVKAVESRYEVNYVSLIITALTTLASSVSNFKHIRGHPITLYG